VICLATEDRTIIAASLLASLAGGSVLLLPYAFSLQAFERMRKATGCTTVLADTPISTNLPAGIEIIEVRRGQTGPNLHLFPASSEQELLRLYTGGSTGAPQIWSKTGSNIFGEAFFLAQHFGVTSQDAIVATISPYHIYGLLYSVVLPLVSGAAILPHTPAFPDEIIRTVREDKATILVSVPVHYRALRGRGALGPSLRLAFSSAGMLDIEDNAEFCRHNEAGIVEVYGSTETGGIALRNRCRGEAGFTPYPTIEWTMADQRLHIRSPYLSPGLPRDAADFFVTGDRVESCHPAGFQLRGRTDSITKVAGKRVDLEEIQALIKEQPGVSDCLVLALADAGGREHRVVALVEGQAVDIKSMRAILADRFEPYALPRAIQTIDHLPVKANGKFDRAAIVRLFQS
jgi:acyl-coenzyme A synthetase/AMP-(fatty) acid ligase